MTVINELTHLEATHVSYVRKGANKKEFFLMKSDEVTPAFQREFPLFINKSDDTEKKLVYGVVYEPGAVDTQGEFAKADTIEAAAHQFLADSRNVDLQHNFLPGSGTVVESYIAPVDFTLSGEKVKKGAWVLVTKASDEVWEGIKKGEITGYSMAGKAKKVPVKKEAADDPDEVRGFFDLMKSFFTKAETAKPESKASAKSFAQRMAVNDVTENMWRVHDTLRETMRDLLSDAAITDKKAALETAIDEYAGYMKKRIAAISDGTVAKSAFFAESPIKGKEGVEEMQKEELQAVVKAAIEEAINPLAEEIAALKKQSEDDAPNTPPEAPEAEIPQHMPEVIKAAFAAQLTAALKPLNDDIATIKKARGLSAQATENPAADKVKKSVFAGVTI